MPYYCTVPRCTSMAGKAKNVSFHQFPRDESLAKLWNEVLKRGKPYTKYSKVCSLHFKPEDYTIATGQKHKGQWRTLRKDAVPSQNLPSETPSSEWQRPTSAALSSALNVDSSLHHQMAQAIYVQTMLAMQAAGVGVAVHNVHNKDQPSTAINETSCEEDSDQSSVSNGTEIKQDTINILEKVYKCDKCSKCFKDPDVLLLHQRSHTKNSLAGNTEMLKANPILANLLKSDSENVNKNVVSIENQIMSALTENMANYLKNLSTIMTAGNTDSGVENKNNIASMNCIGLPNVQSDNFSNGNCMQAVSFQENRNSNVENDVFNRKSTCYQTINNIASKSIDNGRLVNGASNCDN